MIVNHPTVNKPQSYSMLAKQCLIVKQSMEQYADPILTDCIKQLDEIANYLYLLNEDDEAFENNPHNYLGEIIYGDLPESNCPA